MILVITSKPAVPRHNKQLSLYNVHSVIVYTRCQKNNPRRKLVKFVLLRIYLRGRLYGGLHLCGGFLSLPFQWNRRLFFHIPWAEGLLGDVCMRNDTHRKFFFGWSNHKFWITPSAKWLMQLFLRYF